ncbi:DNA-binding transcriptional MerR regulator [Angulomicrobium tetraedrale]|uniref:DNA-binding transcriptional MerR regulator n=1 Tax=Ancylobacter tetraedralis TaxID=217068 RepID=A0A839Z8I1_9HYPH|nr:helix-turn-helix domain-containing protein [Ancylobacter tetraedralis]MBB3770535.1 DNA-binding transcriptional MerR regulator [Ancylobacter tetraedralis]
MSRTEPAGTFTIGEAARSSGVKVPTIRYYEEIGLLPAPPRTEGGRRSYGAADMRRLAFIRHARELGFEIEAIRTLLQLQDQPEQPCAAADAIARDRLIEVERRIASLTALKAELQRMVEGCSHGHVAACRVIEILADHGECRHHHGPAEPGGIGR